MLKLLHIADVHLDAPFRWLGGKGGEQRRQLRETFRAVIDLALAEQVDALLIAGDLFDSNAPAQDSVDLVRAQLRRLAVPVFILPGTHDCLDDGSIYRRLSFAGTDVCVFDETSVAFELPTLDLTVHGRANLTKTSPASPLKDLERSPATRFNVALAHGSLAMPGAEDDFPITRHDLARAGMDYVALGHWHCYRDCSAGEAKACYAGPPELLGEDEQGYALLVHLDEAGTRVEPRAVGRRRYQRLAVDLGAVGGEEEVRQQALALADPDLILSLVLGGLRPLDLVIDPGRLSAELEDSFFALRVKDESQAMLSPEAVEAFPENLVLGQFARRMLARIEAASDEEERRAAETALQLGVALLQGRRVL